VHHPLENVFRNIDFNSEAALGRTRQRNERLRELLNDFADERLDLRPSRVSNLDIIGNTHEYLIGRFAAGAGKKAGEFYTPPEVSILLANLSSVIASLDSGVSVHAEDLNLFICQVFALRDCFSLVGEGDGCSGAAVVPRERYEPGRGEPGWRPVAIGLDRSAVEGVSPCGA
jgi:hypothetical protein